MIRLSPLNFRGLIANAEYISAPVERKKNPVTEIVSYRCDLCDEDYEDKDEAEDCDCETTVNLAVSCPVCKSAALDHRQAADCCLWKDIDAATRYNMADQVEDGLTWAEVLGVDA